VFYFIFYSGLNGPVKPNSNVGGGARHVRQILNQLCEKKSV
jgi:hypothetical protein